MKKASVLLLSMCLLIGLSPVTASAGRDQPAAVLPDPDITLPVSYITHPCILYTVSPPETGPMVASCLSPLNTTAWIG
ncbi:MAG: hypothetical protein JXA25_16990, partial [Anaerolineales bacterium]|nr:hypothetical protein [Anaerolineales bacterium]